MLKTRTTWREKLEREPKIVAIPPKMVKRFGSGKMLIPSPLDVETLIRKVKKGKLVTQDEIRRRLGRDSKVDVTCPITTGIFVHIVAEAAEEDLREGKKHMTPYWRVIKADGSLNEKFPGGTKGHAEHLKAEGHIVMPREGKNPPKVKDFEKSLQKL
jgi:hypothetical protein